MDDQASSPGRLPPVAVIGAGFSGTMAAIQLAGALPPERPVLLCERAEAFGAGLAYGTSNPEHLLNVRAANMSAYPDRPDHFGAWLDAAGGARRALRHAGGPVRAPRALRVVPRRAAAGRHHGGAAAARARHPARRGG
jgi:uncharacterized NAD(P)/FAD-binding protein YdhS